jgi:hypothetical protein
VVTGDWRHHFTSFCLLRPDGPGSPGDRSQGNPSRGAASASSACKEANLATPTDRSASPTSGLVESGGRRVHEASGIPAPRSRRAHVRPRTRSR